MNTKDERDICKAELHIEINESKNRVKKVLDYSQDVPLITKILNDDLLKITHKFIFFALADSDEDFGDRNSLQKVQRLKRTFLFLFLFRN